MSNSSESSGSTPLLFTIFKAVMFVLLMDNLVAGFAGQLFAADGESLGGYLQQDIAAMGYLPKNFTIWELLETYAVTIDYVAWMILVVIFELETGPLSEDKLKGWLKGAFNGTVAACYIVLLYAGYGYVVGLVDFHQYDPIRSGSACELVDENYAFVNMEALFIPLTETNCTQFSSGDLFKHRTDNLIANAPTLVAAVKLAWIDVINATAWLLIVLLFEVEVIMKDKHALSKNRNHLIKASKTVFYLSLLGCAIYWTVHGAFLDYWDAYLWLVAFVLIDLNLFNFQKSSTNALAPAES
jgi:hypothetical protein